MFNPSTEADRDVLADWGIYPVRESAGPPVNWLPVQESPPTRQRASRFTDRPRPPATSERVHETAGRLGNVRMAGPREESQPRGWEAPGHGINLVFL